jgi:hypothetical protein
MTSASTNAEEIEVLARGRQKNLVVSETIYDTSFGELFHYNKSGIIRPVRFDEFRVLGDHCLASWAFCCTGDYDKHDPSDLGR